MQAQNFDTVRTATRQHDNAEIVRRAYNAFNTADMKTLTESFDENASWHTPGRSSAAGNRKGRDAVFTQFGRYGGETAGTFKAELRYVAADDDGRVVGFHHNSGEREGKRLDTDCCIVFELKDGRATSGREHFSTSTIGTSSGRSAAGASPAGVWSFRVMAAGGRGSNHSEIVGLALR